MAITLFIFGLPGSGKSLAARRIKSLARGKKFHPRRFRDYTILYKMFQDDQKLENEKKRFLSTQHLGYDGFDVLDFELIDEALQKLHHHIVQRQKLADDSTELLIIEFSRVDYCEALSFFHSLRLHDAHFLFINSDISTCKARIKARADHPRTLDDRYVSDYIFDVYYQRDHQQYMTEVALQLKQRFGVPVEHIQVIHNGSETSVEQFYQDVESFANDLLKIKV
jgi:adenylate kinase family enzyme